MQLLNTLHEFIIVHCIYRGNLSSATLKTVQNSAEQTQSDTTRNLHIECTFFVLLATPLLHRLRNSLCLVSNSATTFKQFSICAGYKRRQRQHRQHRQLGSSTRAKKHTKDLDKRGRGKGGNWATRCGCRRI